MPASEKCEKIIQVINSLTLITGIITSIVGTTMIPQDLGAYVGSGESYQADLKALQLSSYGFKVALGGIIAVGYSILGCGCIYGYRQCKRDVGDSVGSQPSSPPEPKPLKSILKDTNQLQLNIRKWSGTVNPNIL